MIFHRSLRFRLMLWSSLVVVVTAGLTLMGMQVGVRRALLQEMDQFLIEEADDVSRLLVAEDITSVARRHSTRTTDAAGPLHKHFVAVIEREAGIVWSSTEPPRELTARRPLGANRPINIGNHRVVERTTTDFNSRPLVIRVGAPLSVIDEDVEVVDWLAADVAFIALVIAPVFGFWLASRSVGVIREMMGHTSRMRPAQLDERLPIRGTGDELDQLAGTVNGLLDRIASFLSHRQDLLANAAHELRTPLTVIQTSVDVALSQTRTTSEYEDVLVEVIEECCSLELLVNQLLLLAEADADRLRIGERVVLDAVVKKSAATLAALAEEIGIRIQVETEPAEVEGNAQHLRQVVNNLLDNALKFTPPGGSVRIILKNNVVTQRVELIVSDSGIGIAASDLPHIFERFFRCDRSRSHAGTRRGTGLGLSICDSIIAAHGGSIIAESELGKGTSFCIQLPITADARPIEDTL